MWPFDEFEKYSPAGGYSPQEPIDYGTIYEDKYPTRRRRIPPPNMPTGPHPKSLPTPPSPYDRAMVGAQEQYDKMMGPSSPSRFGEPTYTQESGPGKGRPIPYEHPFWESIKYRTGLTPTGEHKAPTIGTWRQKEISDPKGPKQFLPGKYKMSTREPRHKDPTGKSAQMARRAAERRAAERRRREKEKRRTAQNR